MSLMEIALDRAIPASVDAERTILGALLVDDTAADQLDGLAEEAFYLDSHRRIFNVQKTLRSESKAVDILTLTDRLLERKLLDSVGGRPYLCSLTEGIPRRLNIREYVRIVCEKWHLRQVISVCQDYAARAADQGEESPQDLITAADRDLLAITADERTTLTLGQQSLAESDRLERQRAGKEEPAFDFGIPTLDRLIGGLHRGELTSAGGRPAMGKTAFKTQTLIRHGRRGIPIHTFELEMTAGQTLRRIWAEVSGVPFHKLRRPERQTDEEHQRVLAAMDEVATWPLVIDDSSTLSIDQLVSRVRSAKRRIGTQIVFVDYLQKMKFAGRPEHRYLAVTDAAVQLARLAKDEHLAVMLLSSVSEKSGSSRNNPPTLQDFRQSGDIAYESHCALLIHREIDDETEAPKETGEIIVAKARSDQPGCVQVKFNSKFLRFEDASGAETGRPNGR